VTITYPTFWRGGCADVERTIKDLFTHTENLAASGLTGLEVVSWLPQPADAAAWLNAGNGFLRVYRTGGTVDRDKHPMVDMTRVQIAAWCTNRDASWELIEYVREILYAFVDGGTVKRSTTSIFGLTTTFIRVPGELVGPQLLPEQIRDDRLVPVTFEIQTDRPKGLPDYREQLQLD
jgi:hypothetical protein